MIYRAVAEAIAARLNRFSARGVEIVDARQTFIGPEVQLERVRPGVRLHPGARLEGARTYLAPEVQIGTEGPATVRDAALGRGATVASGFVHGAVLLAGASVGAGAHVRPGSLLEEQASTAHAVGLKQTVLLAFVTLGSLINFCDCLMAGGTSRRDHSEVGSGFVHFNFTPWGASGDKATPSRVGDVPRGVFLRERRIFLGGSGGLVGPAQVGFGAVTGAGQVTRGQVASGRLSVQPPEAMDVEIDPNRLGGVQPRAAANLDYIGQLVALRQWYRGVRMARCADPDESAVLAAAVEALGICIDERVKRLRGFMAERGSVLPPLNLEPEVEPWSVELRPEPGRSHVEWVQSLDVSSVDAGVAWLQRIVESVVAQ